MSTLKFAGTLCTLDSPSLKPPCGSRGNNVVLTRAAALASLTTLVGAPINFSACLSTHPYPYGEDQQAGVITDAYIVRNLLRVRGYINTKLCKPVIKALELNRLGLSYEMRTAHFVRGYYQRESVLFLTETRFAGVAILLRHRCAYKHVCSFVVRKFENGGM
jgi:hypothetical protein